MRERTASLFAGPRVFAVAAAELSALVAKKVDLAFRNRAQWARMAILKTERIGKFSSHRSIAE
jgi:glycogen phosphorylase